MQIARGPGRKRFLTACLCFVATVICYADRTNIGIAIPSFLTNKQEQGQVLSAFYYGYMSTQIMGGFLAQKLGAKSVLLGGVITWSIFDVSTVLVAKCLGCLFLTRASMGLGEGILFPCMHQIAASWYPQQERSLLVAFVSSGMDVGTIVALTFSTALLDHGGWKEIFWAYGVCSLIWVIAFACLGASYPEEDPSISPEEKRFIIANRVVSNEQFSPLKNDSSPRTDTKLKHSSSGHHQELPQQETEAAAVSCKANDASSPRTHSMMSPTSEDSPRPHHRSSISTINWDVLLRSKAAWAVYCAHFCHNYGWYVLLGWIPQYFRQKLDIDIGKRGFTAALPYCCGYLGVLFFGKVSDYLLARRCSTLLVRKLMNGTASFGAALFLYCLRFATSAAMAIALLSVTLFLARSSTCGYWVNMIDIAPSHAGHVMGMSNTIATIPGIIGNVVTGKILDASGSWNVVFTIASCMLCIGGLVFQQFASDQDIYKVRCVSQDDDDIEAQTETISERSVLDQDTTVQLDSSPTQVSPLRPHQHEVSMQHRVVQSQRDHSKDTQQSQAQAQLV